VAPHDPITEHYSRTPTIVDTIIAALGEAGIERDEIRPEHLGGVDEFHLGGAMASDAVCTGIALPEGGTAVDLGCGIGGLARRVAQLSDVDVLGIDLTPSFIDAATELSELVDLDDRTTFEVGSILDLPVADDTIDLATMFHVGMNIDDKVALMAEAARVLAPGGRFVVYDVMRVSDGEIEFPVPWASDVDSSFLVGVGDYVGAMEAAGMVVQPPVDHTELVVSWIAAAVASPPPVNLGHLMGSDFSTMIGNLSVALRGGMVAPTQIVAVKA